ncbi:pectate lyase family protein [Gaoshiqia sp. Z1-71]|uniref:pectate lyase family protein n=1 Tax=Gaoshiqia hydrogeniformans TaxID=3290090 RepID=UPI003BF85249
MKMKSGAFAGMLLLLMAINACKDDDPDPGSAIEISFDNANPLTVDLSAYRPLVTGEIAGELPLKSYSAILVNQTNESILVRDFSLEGSLLYRFDLVLPYTLTTTGLRIEAVDQKNNQKSVVLPISVKSLPAADPQPITNKDAFPGAEGFGRYTTGGRGGKILFVENLSDDGKPGSLRWAVNQSGARTILFRVSGTIELNSPLIIAQGNLTIAGHSAPGDGICISKDYMQLKDGLDNVIIRYLRFRPAKGSGEYDAAWGRNCSNILIDHCSFSWANDEVASFYDNENFTMQWSIISESFYHSTHPKGDHGYGGIWGGMGASFHHNLIAHHTSRNPRFCGARYHPESSDREIVDFRNNVIYNWGANSAYGGELGQHNLVNNYFKSGPATQSAKKNRIVEIYSLSAVPDSKWYIEGNYVEGYPAITADNWAGGVQGLVDASVRASSPFPEGEIMTTSAQLAFDEVLNGAGASKKRDQLDARITNEVRTGTAAYGGAYGAGSGIIDSENEVGGFPLLITYGQMNDFDNDGMDDDWERANGLNPNDPGDHRGNTLRPDYTNLEVYLNNLLEN